MSDVVEPVPSLATELLLWKRVTISLPKFQIFNMLGNINCYTRSQVSLASSLFPGLPDCNLDMVLALLCSATGGGGVGSSVSSSGMVGHDVKVLLPASEGVTEAPAEGSCFTASHSVANCAFIVPSSNEPISLTTV